MTEGSRPQLDEHSEVVGSIYQAALGQGTWVGAMEHVATSLKANSAFMFSSHSDTDPKAVLQVHNHGPEMLEGFSAYWHTQDAWALAARRGGHMARNTIVLGSELISRRELHKTAFFNDFTRHHEMEAMVGSVLFDGTEVDAMPFTNLCWYRPPGQADFGVEHKEAVGRLIPHFQRALRIQRQVRSLRSTDNPSATALTGLNVASILMDAQCCVLQSNAIGLRWLSSELPPSAYRDGRLRCLGEKSAPTLQEAMLLCRFGVPVRLAVRMAGPTHAIVGATLIQLAADRASAFGTFSDAKYLLLIEMPRISSAELVLRVAQLFDLTRTEMRVLELLLEGCSAAEMTRKTSTSMATVRSHIRNIFGKTDVKRQIDLVRLVSSLRM